MDRLIERVRTGTPLLDFMQFAYVDSDADGHRFQAPYDRNKNQLDVAFGGAIATGLTMSGWCAFTDACEELLGRDCNPVVAKAEQRFMRPLTGTWLHFYAPRVVGLVKQDRIRFSIQTQALNAEGLCCAESDLTFVL